MGPFARGSGRGGANHSWYGRKVARRNEEAFDEWKRRKDAEAKGSKVLRHGNSQLVLFVRSRLKLED